MDRQGLIEELRKLSEGYLKNQGLELVDLVYRYEGRGLVLKILVDRPSGGITVSECARINNEISNIMDERDMVQGRYILEVSSPGLDRPLKTRNDFLRCIDRRVRFFLSEPINLKSELEGTVIRVEDTCVYISVEADTQAIPLANIQKAVQIIGA